MKICTINEHKIYVVSTVYKQIRRNTIICEYVELVGHKQDILASIKTDEGYCNVVLEVFSNYEKIGMPNWPLKPIITKLPCGLFHAAIFGDLSRILVSSEPELPLNQLFQKTDKYDIPFMSGWIRDLKPILQKEHINVLESFGGVHGWEIAFSYASDIEKIVKAKLKKRILTPLSKPLKEDNLLVPNYNINFKSIDIKKLTKQTRQALKEISTDGIWAKGLMQSFLEKKNHTIPASLMPLRNGHVGLVFAAGNLNNVLLDNGQEKILIKYSSGKILKDKTITPEEETRKEYLQSAIKYIDFADKKIKVLYSDAEKYNQNGVNCGE